MSTERSVKLALLVAMSGSLVGGLIVSLPLPSWAEEKTNLDPLAKVETKASLQVPLETEKFKESLSSATATAPIVYSVGELQQTPTTVQEWRAQANIAAIKIIEVQLTPTDQGINIAIKTESGTTLATPTTRTQGNISYTDIPNAVLSLPNGNEFKVENPAKGIANISVTQVSEAFVRVIITGIDGLPNAQVVAGEKDLTISATPSSAIAGLDEEEDITVTGDRPNAYRVPNASTATRTDTPLRDIPASIQVVPRQVLQDRQARSITDALENVSGVTSIATTAGSRDYFTIRGFEVYSNSLVNGLPDPQISSDGSFVNVERLEVLKGPASVLYGDTGFSGIGGTVNFVTKQPLRDPFYEISTTISSFNDYQGTIDLSGPLNDSKTALYRFNFGYRSSESFIDFNQARKLSIAPNLSFNLGKDTDLVVEGDVNILERNGQTPQDLPAVGTVLANPNGKIRRSFNLTGPVTDRLTINGRVGYSLEHRFSENWKLRNAFRYVFYDADDRGGAPDFSPTSLQADNRTLNRSARIGSQFSDFYYLDTNLLGKFSTGSINHQLLIGFSLSRNTTDLNFEFGIPAAPVDIFNPVYDNTVVSTGRNFVSLTTRDTLGIYLQDQITLAENLKLLLGGRVDFLGERRTDRLTNEETSQSDTAFSPRVGVVYQPIQPISLYASFAQSFAPTIGISASGEAFKPERGTQYEIGVKADLTSKLSTTLAFYDLTRTNVTTTDPNDPNFSVQTGEQRSRGIELDISGEILPEWNIIAGYAYNDAKVTKDNTIPVGNRLFSAPEHSFNLWTTYRIQKGDLQGLGIGLGFYYVGDRAADLANTFEVPSYFRTDAAIFYEREQFRAALNFRNLFNVDHYQAVGSGTFVGLGDPFTVQATISWKF